MQNKNIGPSLAGVSAVHPEIARVKTCPECRVGFFCGPRADTGRCWCDELPALIPPLPGADCLCPDCLKAKLGRKISRFIAALPPAARRRSIAMQYDRPGVAPVEGLDFYQENGYIVFTPWYHLKRGDCCGNGCRHCPYG